MGLVVAAVPSSGPFAPPLSVPAAAGASARSSARIAVPHLPRARGAGDTALGPAEEKTQKGLNALRYALRLTSRSKSLRVSGLSGMRALHRAYMAQYVLWRVAG